MQHYFLLYLSLHLLYCVTMNRLNCIKCSTLLHPQSSSSQLDYDSFNVHEQQPLLLKSERKSVDESFIVLQSVPHELDQSKFINNMVDRNLENNNDSNDLHHSISFNLIHSTESFHDIMNNTFIVQHPLCLQCSEELMNRMDIKRLRIQIENDRMQSYLNSLDPTTDTELDRLVIEKDQVFILFSFVLSQKLNTTL